MAWHGMGGERRVQGAPWPMAVLTSDLGSQGAVAVRGCSRYLFVRHVGPAQPEPVRVHGAQMGSSRLGQLRRYE